jgi:hypothetical protein
LNIYNNQLPVNCIALLNDGNCARCKDGYYIEPINGVNNCKQITNCLLLFSTL